MNELAQAWDRTLVQLGLRPGPASTAVRDRLLAAYAEPHRRYHDQLHLSEVLAATDDLAAGPDDLPAADRPVVALAAWCHDAVYDPTAAAGANEEASAQLAEQLLSDLGLDPTTVGRVATLVRGTATHSGAVDARDELAAAVMDDADLAILASRPERYADYAAAVRSEYAHVPEAAFRAGRRAILLDFLGRRRIYRTRAGYDAWEQRAREQVGAEVDRLGES